MKMIKNPNSLANNKTKRKQRQAERNVDERGIYIYIDICLCGWMGTYEFDIYIDILASV